MGITNKDFDLLEQQFLELIGEYRSIVLSESRLRELVRVEATRAEAAEAACARAERAAAESRAAATAATAGATQATTELTAAYEQVSTLKVQLELMERQKIHLEEKHSEMISQINAMERELHVLRPLQATQSALQNQYLELQERINSISEEARRESSRLESDLRKVERCASGGAEVRERARLAAAAHARERRRAAADLHHAARELHAANVEIARLTTLVNELQIKLTSMVSKGQPIMDPDIESVSELRAALQAERAGSEKLEKALAAALSDNAELAAQMSSKDNNFNEVQKTLTPPGFTDSTNICQIDSFLAE